MPGTANLSDAEANKVANAVINRLLLFNKGNGKYIARVTSVIPSPEYAKKNQYDISQLHPANLPTDFDGFLTVANWSMSIISFLKIENGKPVDNLNIKRRSNLQVKRKNLGMEGRYVCPDPVWVPARSRICVSLPVGDDVSPDECDEWGPWIESQTEGHWELPDCYDDGEDDGEGDELDDCMSTNLNPNDCFCLIFGIGCDGDGDGEEPPLPEIWNHVDDPCLRDMVNKAISQGVKNKIADMIQNTFANNANMHLQFRDANLSNGPSASDDANTEVQPIPPHNIGQEYKILIRLNTAQLANASEEYLIATIFHECMHAMIDYLYPTTNQNVQQHDLMVTTSRFNDLLQALIQVCPSLANNVQDATDLTWGGMYNTILFNSLSINEKNRIVQRNLDYKNRINNTGTPCTP